jgi:hypothetical protein
MMTTSRQSSPAEITIDQRQPEIVKYFKYLGSMITKDIRRTRQSKSRIAIANAASNKKNTLFYQKIGLTFKKETGKVLHLEHSFVWC